MTDELLQRILFECCTLHAGQACILNSRLLLPDSIHDDVVARLVELARAIVVGDPADPATEMGPLISEAHLQNVCGHVERAVTAGARIAAGGGRPAHLDAGHFFQPTVLVDVTPDSAIAQEEVFGPVLSVIRYAGDDDAVAIANNSPYGLSGAVWGTDVDRALGVARAMRTGQVTINGCGPGDAPFGGFKLSGYGREGGLMGLRHYMEPKAIGLP